MNDALPPDSAPHASLPAFLCTAPGLLTWLIVLSGSNPFLVWPLLTLLQLSALVLTFVAFRLPARMPFKLGIAAINLSFLGFMATAGLFP